MVPRAGHRGVHALRFRLPPVLVEFHHHGGAGKPSTSVLQDFPKRDRGPSWPLGSGRGRRVVPRPVGRSVTVLCRVPTSAGPPPSSPSSQPSRVGTDYVNSVGRGGGRKTSSTRGRRRFGRSTSSGQGSAGEYGNGRGSATSGRRASPSRTRRTGWKDTAGHFRPQGRPTPDWRGRRRRRRTGVGWD